MTAFLSPGLIIMLNMTLSTLLLTIAILILALRHERVDLRAYVFQPRERSMALWRLCIGASASAERLSARLIR